ncbi:excinuclease ABC subunit UvrA, partial [Escherichia coli]
ESPSEYTREQMKKYMVDEACHTCHGYRLSKEAMSVKINDQHIGEVVTLSIGEALQYFSKLELSKKEQQIAELVLKEITERLTFLYNVGLEYPTLNRTAGTLSGGEAQRILLATQIGSRLTGVMDVLDEPSIGLHQRD